MQHKNTNLDAFQTFLTFSDDFIGDQVHTLAILRKRAG